MAHQASFNSVFSSSQRLRVACISAIIDMALLVSFHAELLSFGNASIMSRSVYEVALSGSLDIQKVSHTAGRLCQPSVPEFGAGNLYFQVKPVNQTIPCSPRSVSIPRVSIAQADFPR